MNKPAGIVLIAIYSLISGIISVFLGVLMLIGSGMANSFPMGFSLLGVITFVTGVLEIAVYYGLWTFQKWGHLVAKYLYFAYIPMSLIIILIDSSIANLLIQSAFIGISVIILHFLLKPEIESLYQ